MGSKLGFVPLGKKIIAEEGVGGLYKGLDAGMARQLTYGMTRLGVFRTLTEKLKKKRQKDHPGESDHLPLWQKSVCALTAGAVGALVGNPADLAVVRLTSDIVLPKEVRKNYSGVMDVLKRTVKKDGIVGLWRGGGMTVTRCMALNLGQLASADQARDVLENMGAKRGVRRHFIDFFASFLSSRLSWLTLL